MGLTCALWRVSEGDVARLSHASAAEVTNFLFGEPQGPPAARSKGLIGWLKDLSPIKIESVDDYLDAPRGPSQARAELDLDKSWHGLHYLLTGTAWEGDEPACFLVQGGAVLGEDADEECQARVLSRAEVAAFSRHLSSLTTADLLDRFDARQMMALEIYPEIWDRPDEVAISRQYLADNFDALRRFVEEAALEGDRLVIMVT
jgi:hypothetical protein